MSLSGYVDTRDKGMARLGRISVHAMFGGIAHPGWVGDSRRFSNHACALEYWIRAFAGMTSWNWRAHYWFHFTEIRLQLSIE
jgi:hypothetical protein